MNSAKDFGIGQPWHKLYYSGLLQCNGCAFTAKTEEEMVEHCSRCPADGRLTLAQARGWVVQEETG